MQWNLFDSGIAQIYDMFTNARSPSADQRQAWHDRLKHIPDEAVNFIVERICDFERLPSNMPLAWRNLWADWKAANPSRIMRPDCPACRNSGARHGWARQEDGEWMIFGFPCPICQHDESREPVSIRELEAKGCVIMPVDYLGGAVAFDRDNNFGCLWPVSLDTSTPRPQMKVGGDHKQDFNRVRHLPPAEREDYAQTANW